MTGKVYAVASGKGGVGKTTTVVNLGVTLRADGHSVVLVDADLGMANLGTLLGIDHEPTLHEVLAGGATLDEALTEQAERFAILPGARSLRQYAEADPASLGSVLEELAERYEYVLVDTGAGVGYDDVLPLEFVDEVVLIATPDGAALGDAGKTAEIAELVGANVRGVVLTRTDEDDDPEKIAGEMGVDLLAAVPDDPAVPESTASGRPLEAHAPESEAAAGYRRLAATLTGRDVERFEPPEAAETPTGAAETSGGSGKTPGEADEGTDGDAPEPNLDEESAADDSADESTDPDEEPSDESATAEPTIEDDTAEPATEDDLAEDSEEEQEDDETATEPDETATESEEPTTEPEETASDADEPLGDDEVEDEPADEDGSSGGLFARLGRLFR